MKKVLPKEAILVPDNGNKVFEGKIFDVYQWPQKLFDGTNAIFELLRRPDTVQVIAVHNDKLVLVDDEQPGRTPRLHFPGGRAEEGDASWEEAAKREMLEETGLSFSNWRLIDVQQPIPKIEWFVPLFLATGYESKIDTNHDPGEKIEVHYLKFTETHKRILSGTEPTLNYAVPLFLKVRSLEELLAMQKFPGKEVDR